MTQFEKAASLFGKDGAGGESDAIVNYLMFISRLKEDYPNLKPVDEMAIENVIERISDEINHLLGDTLDAVRMAGLKISPDGLDDILSGLREAANIQEIFTDEVLTSGFNSNPRDMINL